MSFDFDAFCRKYDPHPETVAFIRARVEDNVQPYPEVGAVKARENSLKAALKYGGHVDFDGTEKEFVIPSPYDQGGLPVTVYRPTSCDSMEAPPIIVYFHGGGNTVGCRRNYDTVCKILASGAPCIMASVEYRLAPEHKFPANNDDANVAVEWVAANKSLIGGKTGSKVGVSGDSAGGRLAAVVCHETECIDFAILVYPNVSMRFEHDSVQEFRDGPVLAWSIIEWFMEQYITEADKTSPRASVVLNKDFSSVPPTMMIVAELDPLRDGCYDYHGKLKEAGITTELVTIKGVPHAFWGLPGAYKETCKEAHTAAVKFIQKFSS